MNPKGSTILSPLTTEWGRINGEVKYKGKLLFLKWLPSSSQVTALYTEHGNMITVQYSSELNEDSNEQALANARLCEAQPHVSEPLSARLKMPSKMLATNNDSSKVLEGLQMNPTCYEGWIWVRQKWSFRRKPTFWEKAIATVACMAKFRSLQCSSRNFPKIIIRRAAPINWWGWAYQQDRDR